MRHSLTLGLLSVTLMLSASPLALAQAPAPQTLDGQMQHLQQTSPQLPPSVPPDAYREWPGTPSMATGPEQDTDEVIDSQGSGAIPSLPLEVQSMGGVTFITGGIGDEEIDQLKSSKHQYNLHMLMSAPGGAFISDVTINIADVSGKNLASIQGAGPYFYVRLTPGKYTVELNEDGQTKKFSVNIKDGSHIDRTVQFNETGGVTTLHQGTATVE